MPPKGRFMKIDILSETTLKLTLTADDMDRHQLCYESLSKDGDNFKECRETLGRILKSDSTPESEAMAAQLLENGRRLFIEAFKRMDGGCMLYVSALDRRRKGSGERQLLDKAETSSPIIFETESGEALGALCRCLILEQLSGSAEFKSKLFTDGRSYRLALTPLNTCTAHIMRLMNEYGTANCSELSAAFTEEYFRPITDEDGVGIGSRIF